MASESVKDLAIALIKTLGQRAIGLISKVVGSSYSMAVVRGAIVAAALYDRLSVWFSPQNRQTIIRELLQSSKLIKMIQDIISWFRKPPPCKKVNLSVAEGVRIAESRVIGSEETPLQHKTGELLVLDADKRAVGKAARIFDVLVLPEHVLCTALQEGGKAYVAGTNLRQTIELQSDQTEHLCADIVGIKLSQSDWANLGAPKVRIGCLASPLTTTVTGCLAKGTTGRLSNFFDAGFGMVRYSGTTLAGYSGALYCNGSTAYGMHLTGGTHNLGVAMDYLRCLVKSKWEEVLDEAKNYKYDYDMEDGNEGSTYGFFNTLVKGGKRRDGVRVDRVDLDEIHLFAEGKYQVVNKGKFMKHVSKKTRNAILYNDAEYGESLPLQNPVFVKSPSHGASSTNTVIKEQEAKADSISNTKSLIQLLGSEDAESKSLSASAMKKYGWALEVTPEQFLKLQDRLKESQRNRSQSKS